MSLDQNEAVSDTSLGGIIKISTVSEKNFEDKKKNMRHLEDTLPHESLSLRSWDSLRVYLLRGHCLVSIFEFFFFFYLNIFTLSLFFVRFVSRSAASDIAGPQLHGLETDLKTSRTKKSFSCTRKKSFPHSR